MGGAGRNEVQAVFGAFENRRDRPGDLNLQAATGGKIFKNAVWRKKRACVTTSHFLLSLSVPSALSLSLSPPSLSLFLSSYASLSLSLSHSLRSTLCPPQPRSPLFHPFYMYIHVHAYVCTYVCVCVCVCVCTRVLAVWRRFPSSSFLFTRSSPPKQIVKTPSSAAVIA